MDRLLRYKTELIKTTPICLLYFFTSQDDKEFLFISKSSITLE